MKASAPASPSVAQQAPSARPFKQGPGLHVFPFGEVPVGSYFPSNAPDHHQSSQCFVALTDWLQSVTGVSGILAPGKFIIEVPGCIWAAAWVCKGRARARSFLCGHLRGTSQFARARVQSLQKARAASQASCAEGGPGGTGRKHVSCPHPYWSEGVEAAPF